MGGTCTFSLHEKNATTMTALGLRKRVVFLCFKAQLIVVTYTRLFSVVWLFNVSRASDWSESFIDRGPVSSKAIVM